MKIKPIATKIFFILSLFLLIDCNKKTDTQKPDTQAGEIISRITNTKNKILEFQKDGKRLCQNEGDCLFLSFWDFDGTILKGDCSEGLSENGMQIYKGMDQLAIEGGYSTVFAKDKFEDFEKEYKKLDLGRGHLVAYEFLAQIYKGQDRKKMEAFSATQFENSFQKYYFKQSIEIFNSMRTQKDFRVFVISASPDFFVKGAANTIKLPPSQVRGINVEDKDGKLTNRLIFPINYAQGKTESVQKIVNEVLAEGKYKNVFVLAGFGNSYHTDGEFLSYIAKQDLPAGKPIAVMVNGGKSPAEYDGLFYTVSHTMTVQ